MTFIRDHLPEEPQTGESLSFRTAVSGGEKELLFDRPRALRRPKRFDRRTAVLMLIAAAFGFLAAVFVLRLFPL
jgi:hypothetical protein